MAKSCLISGFADNAQRENFRSAGRLHGRGGAKQKICGARRHGGGVCRRAPLKGHWRCLMHCGPKAARTYRERQLADLRAGKLSPAEFQRAEARRAANRLRTMWRKDPWLLGSTIDLGDHEEAFLRAVGPSHLQYCAPSVLDWLRWRYRRLCIDREQMQKWQEVVHTDMPKRIAEAGPRPRDILPDDSETAGGPWCAAAPAPFSRRRTCDRERAAVPPLRTKPLPRLPRCEAEKGALLDQLFRDRQDLIPILAACRSDEDRLILAQAHDARMSGAPGSMQSWMAVLQRLGLIAA